MKILNNTLDNANILSKLGQRETQIFEMLSEGKKTSQIAEELFLNLILFPLSKK